MASKSLLLCLLIAAPLLAQQPRPTTNSVPPMAPGAPVTAQPVAPDVPVITVHGVCPAEKPSIGQKTDSCTVVLTRAQFEGMVRAINLSNQPFTPAALRSLGSGYVTLMALANAGEKAGVENDPRFQEQMDVARTRSLAEVFRQSLLDKYGNPSDEEVRNYYQQNLPQFEQVRIDRILVPKVNPLHSQDKPAEFQKKAGELAAQIRERAAKGEDPFSLQAEVYKTLAIKTMPPQIEVNPLQIRLLSKAVQDDLHDLKPGEVTKVEVESSGFNIYKIRSKNTLSLEQAREQIVRDLQRQNVDAALKAVTGSVHTEFNEQFFSPRGVQPPQLPGMQRPGDAVGSPTRVHTMGGPAAGGSNPATPAASPK
jgi:PPIC-type PPIASE domain